MDAIEHLAETAWKTPDCYGGFNPIGDYLILSRHRDSDLISESNWDVACKSLSAEDHDTGDLETRPAVYTFRAGHWAVGWVEYLLVRPDAPEATLKAAGEIVCGLAEYPVLSDDDLSERECEAELEAWRNLSVRDRADLIRRVSNCSIFAARCDHVPESDNGSIRKALLGY